MCAAFLTACTVLHGILPLYHYNQIQNSGLTMPTGNGFGGMEKKDGQGGWTVDEEANAAGSELEQQLINDDMTAFWVVLLVRRP